MRACIDRLLVIACLIVWLSVLFTRSEVFTALGHMASLVEIEKELSRSLKTFVQKEERKLEVLRDFLSEMELLQLPWQATRKEMEEFVGHPVHAFKLIKRLVEKWPGISAYVFEESDRELIRRFSFFQSSMPSSADLEGARVALERLRHVYNLAPSFFSNTPILSPHSEMDKLTLEDVFSIGRAEYWSRNFQGCRAWMGEAMRLIDHNSQLVAVKGSPSRQDILDYLSWSEYETGYYQSAFDHTVELVQLDPSNTRFLANLQMFHKLTENQPVPTTVSYEDDIKRSRLMVQNLSFDPAVHSPIGVEAEKNLVNSICRGETWDISRKFMQLLVCWLKADHPKLLLKPAKVERIYPDPELLIFHDVIRDPEITRIKELALPELRRATVHNPVTGKLESASYRISKSAWLEETYAPEVASVNDRISTLTGLSMETAELLQVANYGVAGHYDNHFDFARRSDPTRNNMREGPSGNRIATFLIYMTDVTYGGGTAFTQIGQLVRPVKGDAAFWFNLHPDGTGDSRTRHAACPVVMGTKWVSNKWIHERGQEFIRKCTLRPQNGI